MRRPRARHLPRPGSTCSQPSPALPATARLAVAAGTGARRVALWTAANSRGELCTGWRTGPSRRAPTNFTCLRRGLEQPLVSVEVGGGKGGIATWGLVVGLASPRVARIEADTLYGSQTAQPVGLLATASRPGWHTFSTGTLPHPTSTTLETYDAQDTLLTVDSGAAIHPPVSAIGSSSRPPGLPEAIPVIAASGPPTAGVAPTGPAWTDAAANLPAFGAVEQQAISLALADRSVRSILALRGGWLDTVADWTNCSDRSLGRVVGFRFPKAASFTSVLPSISAPQGQFSYSETVRQVAAANWHTMSVEVDTDARAVVAIGTAGSLLPGESGGTTVPLATVVAPHDAGGPDTGSSCLQSGG